MFVVSRTKELIEVTVNEQEYRDGRYTCIASPSGKLSIGIAREDFYINVPDNLLNFELSRKVDQSAAICQAIVGCRRNMHLLSSELALRVFCFPDTVIYLCLL